MTILSSTVVTARNLGLVAALIGVCGGVSAAESDYDWNELPQPMKVNDLRIGMSLLPANADISTNANGVSTYDRGSVFDAAGRSSLMWMMPFGALDEDGGFIGGLELSRNRYRLTGTIYQPDLDIKAYVASMHVGMGWQLTRRTHLETTVFGGYGASSFVSGHYGSYWEYGARAGMFYTFDVGFQVGVHISYLETRMDQNYTDWSPLANQSVSYESTVKTQGGYAGAMVGWRF